MEENKYFNAGRGSFPNIENEVECDAMIMDGHTLKSGIDLKYILATNSRSLKPSK